MTAEQAAEAGKDLDFTKVWAALMRVSAQQEKTSRQQRKTDAQIAKMSERVDKTSERVDKTSERIDKTLEEVAKLSKNMDGVNKSLGKWIEEMVYPNLWDKFDQFGYEFTKGGRRLKFKVNGQTIAEADIFLENGDCAMPVEVKTTLTEEDVDDHLERMDKIRLYLNERNDKRKLVGAVGGAVVSESVLRYAQKKGLYVLVQSGDSIIVAEIPHGFTAKEW